MINLIAKAHASADTAAPAAAGAVAGAPTQGSLMGMNMMMLLLMVVMFYVLLIMPQQKRFKKHKAMMDSLKKGDRVLTAAGFIGTVDSINAEKSEVVIDLGGTKVTALRSSIQNIMTDAA
jgi:preprotein translocase subunit YajC